MEILGDLVTAALIAVIRLGIPLAVLFVIGYQMYQGSKSQIVVKKHGQVALGAHATGGIKSLYGPAQSRPCWESKRCSSKARGVCSAYYNREVPCWLALKASLGRLSADCCDCELFLAMGVTDDERR